MLAPRHRFSALVFVTGFLFLCARVFSGRSWVRKPRSPARFALGPWYLLEVDARWSSPVWAPGKISVDEASLIPHAGARRFSLSQFLPVFVSSCLCLGLFFIRSGRLGLSSCRRPPLCLGSAPPGSLLRERFLAQQILIPGLRVVTDSTFARSRYCCPDPFCFSRPYLISVPAAWSRHAGHR
jgi:hypothetical protein